jgi:hypothetical protein
VPLPADDDQAETQREDERLRQPVLREVRAAHGEVAVQPTETVDARLGQVCGLDGEEEYQATAVTRSVARLRPKQRPRSSPVIVPRMRVMCGSHGCYSATQS